MMGVTTETLVAPVEPRVEAAADGSSDRRADIDAKSAKVTELLREAGCDTLILLEPENFSWMTSGAVARGVLDADAMPAIYCNPEYRWALASNADSQRIFDEELDGLGFQLKEWPWHVGRDAFINELCQGRRVASDRPLPGAVLVADKFRRMRLSLSAYEQACLRALGQIVSHALEATCRSINIGESEREIAGHLSHRLIHRGVQAIHIGVAVDGRSRLYRHYGYTPTTIRHHALVTATGRKYGLTATASRAVCFGTIPEDLQKDHNAVCRVSASYLASTWPDAVPREILLAGRRIYLISGFEHEWLLGPQGHVTGRSTVELTLTPQTEELFQAGWSMTWNAVAGAAASCDTFLITEQGPHVMTPPESWPLKKIRIQGAEFVRPDVLQR
jgi:Xaa-Pro aminopeptidase